MNEYRQLTERRLIGIGDTGVYFDPLETSQASYNWNKNTPENIKKQQLEQIATTGVILGSIILLCLYLTKNS